MRRCALGDGSPESCVAARGDGHYSRYGALHELILSGEEHTPPSPLHQGQGEGNSTHTMPQDTVPWEEGNFEN